MIQKKTRIRRGLRQRHFLGLLDEKPGSALETGRNANSLAEPAKVT